MIFPLFVVSVVLAIISYFFSPYPEKAKVKQVARTEEQRRPE